jgi:hypothetical protein
MTERMIAATTFIELRAIAEFCPEVQVILLQSVFSISTSPRSKVHALGYCLILSEVMLLQFLLSD